MIDTEQFFNEIFIDLQQKSCIEKLKIRQDLVKCKVLMADETTSTQFLKPTDFFELDQFHC